MGMNLAKTFGTNVQRKRKLLGLTQEQLAELLGVGQHTLSRIERGVLTPKFDRLQDFSEHLCTPVSELFATPDSIDTDVMALLSDMLKKHTPEEQTALLDILSTVSMQLLKHRKACTEKAESI